MQWFWRTDEIITVKPFLLTLIQGCSIYTALNMPFRHVEAPRGALLRSYGGFLFDSSNLHLTRNTQQTCPKYLRMWDRRKAAQMRRRLRGLAHWSRGDEVNYLIMVVWFTVKTHTHTHTPCHILSHETITHIHAHGHIHTYINTHTYLDQYFNCLFHWPLSDTSMC